MTISAFLKRNPILIKTFWVRLVLLSVGWFILVGGQLSDLWFVALIIILTTIISLYCIPEGVWNLKPFAVLAFIPFFIKNSIRGGWDVARRTFYRSIPLSPDFITVNLSKDKAKDLILIWTISLLPGTASCEIQGETLIVHVLDKNLPVAEEIEILQKQISKFRNG